MGLWDDLVNLSDEAKEFLELQKWADDILPKIKNNPLLKSFHSRMVQALAIGDVYTARLMQSSIGNMIKFFGTKGNTPMIIVSTLLLLNDVAEASPINKEPTTIEEAQNGYRKYLSNIMMAKSRVAPFDEKKADAIQILTFAEYCKVFCPQVSPPSKEAVQQLAW